MIHLLIDVDEGKVVTIRRAVKPIEQTSVEGQADQITIARLREENTELRRDNAENTNHEPHAPMPTCFVIQPFHGGTFDKRYKDVYEPAIKAADLEPYRVDRDPKVQVPIDAIEDGIRQSVVVLADITLDNPNVWYELGYAFASGKPVIMTCCKDRTGKQFPFDIQHRNITPGWPTRGPECCRQVRS